MRRDFFLLPLILFVMACAKDEQITPNQNLEVRFEIKYKWYEISKQDRWTLYPLDGKHQNGEFYTFNDMEIINSWCTQPLRLNIYNLHVITGKDSDGCETIDTLQAKVGDIITLNKIFYDSENHKFTTKVIQEVVLSKNMETDSG